MFNSVMKQIAYIICAAGLALAASMQNATAQNALATPAASQNEVYSKLEQEIYTIGQTLGKVNSYQSAEAAGKTLLPLVEHLQANFDHAYASKSLSRDQYNRVVRNTHAVYEQIQRLADVDNSFYGSIKLAKVGHKFKFTMRDITHPKKS